MFINLPYTCYFFVVYLMPGPLTSTPLRKGRDLPDISIISTGSSEK